MHDLQTQIAEEFLDAQTPVFDAVRAEWSSIQNAKYKRQTDYVGRLKADGLCLDCHEARDRDGARCIRCNTLENERSRRRYRRVAK